MKKTNFISSMFFIFILGLSGCVSTSRIAEVPEDDDVLARARAVRLLQAKDPIPQNCEKLGSFSIMQKDRSLITPQVQAARAFGSPNYVKHVRVSSTVVAGKADDYDVFSCEVAKKKN